MLSIGGTDIRHVARLPLYLKLISSFDAVVYVAKSHRQLLPKICQMPKSCTYPTAWIKIFSIEASNGKTFFCRLAIFDGRRDMNT